MGRMIRLNSPNQGKTVNGTVIITDGKLGSKGYGPSIRDSGVCRDQCITQELCTHKLL